MSWARLDDKLHGSAAALTAGLEAMGLWALGESWSADQQSDGALPHAVVVMLAGNKTAAKKLAAKLVEAGLWEATSSGFLSKNFTARNPSRQQLDEQRAAERERKRTQRSREVSPDVPGDVPVGQATMSAACPEHVPAGPGIPSHSHPIPIPTPTSPDPESVGKIWLEQTEKKPTASELADLHGNVEKLAAEMGISVEAATGTALEAMRQYIASWHSESARRAKPTPPLMLKHWDAALAPVLDDHHRRRRDREADERREKEHRERKAAAEADRARFDALTPEQQAAERAWHSNPMEVPMPPHVRVDMDAGESA